MELLRSLEDRARSALAEDVYDYFAGGAGDERTMGENAEAWQRLWLRPRHLAGVGEAETSIELLGRRLTAPLLLAPVAAQRLLCSDGELASARAAASSGVGFVLSTRATTDLAEVAAAVPPEACRWFQLYADPDRAKVEAILARAGEHGYEQIVLTADLPVAGRRERELRHGDVPLPEGVTMTTHLGAADPVLAKPPTGGWAVLRWSDIEWISEAAGLPVIVKGVLTAEDARQALAHGASAIIVSNHGGRQLDGCVPTAVALREVVAAVAGAVPVLVDGGVRSGADIARALACGAAAVLIGRPFAWGLAGDGQAGVESVVEAFTTDLARTLTLIGAATCAEVTAAHVMPRGWGFTET